MQNRIATISHEFGSGGRTIGKRIAEEMLWNIRQNEQMLTEGFSGEELDQLREYFRRMTENMERFAQESEIAAEAEACQKLPEGGAKKKERK